MGDWELSERTVPGIVACIECEMSRVFGDLKFGSQIEKDLFEAFAGIHFVSYGRMPCLGGDSVPDQKIKRWRIFPQFEIGRYRLDFLIESPDGNRVAVECDGHDFHERTKDQAAHDRRRDRELQALGYMVLRYTGSEIWHDPMGCAIDILDKACSARPASKVSA